MGRYDEAELCEVIGIYAQSVLQDINKETMGLYRENRLKVLNKVLIKKRVKLE